MKKATNNKELEFKYIKHEIYREYTFPGGDKIKIKNPTAINVSTSGGHRVQDATGMAHYIPSSWIHLCWETNDDVSFLF